MDIAETMTHKYGKAYSHSKVQGILDGLNKHAVVELRQLVPDTLALEFNKSLFLLDFLLKRTLDIEATAKTPYVSLQAIGQAAHLLHEKNVLIADSQMLSRTINKVLVINNNRRQLSTSPQQPDEQPAIEQCECCSAEDNDDDDDSSNNDNEVNVTPNEVQEEKEIA